MGRRRRRAERRQRTAAGGPVRAPRRENRADERRRAAFDATQRALARRSRFIFALGFIPLVGALGCRVGVSFLCEVPQEWWFAAFAAVAGSLLGISIRRVIERRRFERGSPSGQRA